MENQISYDLDQVEINLQDQSSSRKMEEFLIVTAHLHQAQRKIPKKYLYKMHFVTLHSVIILLGFISAQCLQIIKRSAKFFHILSIFLAIC